MLESLTAEDFRARLGDEHRVVPGEAAASEAVEVVLVLDSVTDLPTEPGRPRAPFDVVFRAPMGTDLGQGTYRVEHATVGAMQLFLVPIGPSPDRAGMLYQAVFS